MATTTKKTRSANTAKVEDRLMVSRRLPRLLWSQLQEHVATIVPRTTDTAVLELAIVQYLERHAGKETNTGAAAR